jgi:formylmethanofuran dehydrogenase subunit E
MITANFQKSGENMDEDLKKSVEFHGHLCPGLAIGYRVAKYIKEHHPRSEDEELVCIAENNSCSVDAVQALLGCTFGKGNLVYRDNGKQVFIFYSRGDGKALRIYFKADLSEQMDKLRDRYFKGDLTEEEKEEFENIREQVTQHIINAPDEEILAISEVSIPVPEKARIHPSLKCQNCGEGFMEICGRTVNGKVVCKECFNRIAG